MNVSLWSYHRVRFAVGLTIALCSLAGIGALYLPHMVALTILGGGGLAAAAFGGRHHELASKLELDR